MKSTSTLFITILLVTGMFYQQYMVAQAPEKMSYQAVIRNSSNQLVTNTTIGIRISILQGTIYDASVYVETQSPTTN